MATDFVFAADIGGTSIKLGLFQTDGALLDKWEIPTRTENRGEAILPDVAQAISAKMSERKLSPEQVLGLGIGVPGPVDSNNNVFCCENLGWGAFNLKQRMNELLPAVANVAGGNDANLATLGELWMGGGRGYQSAVMFTLGTGVGAGVVADGRVIAGANGAAGEVGHMTVEPEESLPCSCGKCGCLEQYASANGIVRLAQRMLAACDTPSALRSMEKYTAKDICDLAREGEEMAGAIFDRCAHYLGLAMSWVGNTVNPQVFIIGGGMSRAGEILTESVARYYRTYVFHPSKDTPFVIARLGNDAGIYGCAKLVLN